MTAPTAPHVVAAVMTYNRRESLRRCLDGIRGQTVAPGTVLVVDNAGLVAQGVPVKQFRALQHRPDYIEVLVATDQPDHLALRQLSASLQAEFRAPVIVSVRAVDRIPVERTGKLRRFVSYLGSSRTGVGADRAPGTNSATPSVASAHEDRQWR